jgi:hypothetical protein
MSNLWPSGLRRLHFSVTRRRKSEVVGSNPKQMCQKFITYIKIFSFIFNAHYVVKIELNPNLQV